MLHPSLLQLLLEEHLQGQDELALPLSGQVDVAKFTFSQGTADVKILQAPMPAVRAETCTVTEQHFVIYVTITQKYNESDLL